MKLKIPGLYTCLNLISIIILLVGLGSAILIYRTVEDTPYGILGYEEGGGTVYPIMPEDSKQYLRGLELYGGKANVLMDQLRRGFIGLWHGKSLAFTVACIKEDYEIPSEWAHIAQNSVTNYLAEILCH